jgi:hypothetical protein
VVPVASPYDESVPKMTKKLDWEKAKRQDLAKRPPAEPEPFARGTSASPAAAKVARRKHKAEMVAFRKRRKVDVGHNADPFRQEP